LIPAVAVPVVSYISSRRDPARYNTPGNVQGRCLVLIIVGAAWGMYCLVRLSPLTAASTLFLTDPSCLAGTSPAAKPRVDAPCHSESATIVDAIHQHSRSGYDNYLTLALNDGSRPRVGLPNADVTQQIVEKAQRSPEGTARVQFFEGRIVAVATDDGVAATQWDPHERIGLFQMLALLGAGTFVAGLIEVMRGWQYLF
jgi:hypothetical protein